MTVTGKIEYKFIDNVASMEEVVTLQAKTWGKTTVTVLPHLIAAVHNGGMVIGAYDEGKLVGFVYGFPGFKNGSNFLVSHMMAVLPDYRNDGIGESLKYEQRKWAETHGYEKIRWTYDSLESRNAYLNLHKLKGYVRTYIRAYYGELNDDINKGSVSDRFEVEWDVNEDSKETETEASYPDNLTKLVDWEKDGKDDKVVTPVVHDYPLDETFYLVAVPANIHLMKQENIETAKKWRFAHRQVFEKLFAARYFVVDLKKENNDVNYYIVKHGDGSRASYGG